MADPQVDAAVNKIISRLKPKKPKKPKKNIKEELSEERRFFIRQRERDKEVRRLYEERRQEESHQEDAMRYTYKQGYGYGGYPLCSK